MKRWWIPVALGALLFSWNLWGYDLWAPDEPYFAEGAREMIDDGHWAVVHVNGVVSTDKPPLFFWLIAALSWPAEAVTSFTARLPSVLAAIGSLLLTIRLGRRLFGPETATLAGFLLAVNYMFWDKARSAQTDSVLAFLILLALYAFEGFRSGHIGGRRAGVLFWVACALAVLTKGPVGLLLPVGIVVLTLAFDRSLRRLGGFGPIVGPLCFFVVLAAWIVPASLWDPEQYTVLGALQEHFVDRAVHGMHHAQPFWYYLKVLPVKLMPWSALLPAALVLAWRRRSPADRLLLVVFCFVVVFFSVSTEKRDLYVLPCFPAAALMCASAVESIRRREATLSPRWVMVPLALTGILLALTGVVMLGFASRVDEVAHSVVRAAGLIVLLAGVPATWLALRCRPLRSLGVTLAGIAAFYLFASTFIFPPLDSVKSARAFAVLVKNETADARAAGSQVAAYRLFNVPEALAFYSDGVYTLETNDPKVLAAHLAAPSLRYAVVDANELDRLDDEIEARIRTVATARLSRIDVALIHNQATEP